jgi:hypothetical protein
VQLYSPENAGKAVNCKKAPVPAHSSHGTKTVQFNQDYLRVWACAVFGKGGSDYSTILSNRISADSAPASAIGLCKGTEARD